MVLGSAVAKGSIRSGLVSRETGALPKVYRRRSLSVNRSKPSPLAACSNVLSPLSAALPATAVWTAILPGWALMCRLCSKVPLVVCIALPMLAEGVAVAASMRGRKVPSTITALV